MEDSKLLCSLAYTDPGNVWDYTYKRLEAVVPLNNLTFNSPVSASRITVAKLPLRFLSADSSIFKDTDHPYRWFLAPYVSLYLVTAETIAEYNSLKSAIGAWVNAQTEAQLTTWQLIYVPLGSERMRVYDSVFAALSADFHADRPGDRTTMIIPGSSGMRPSPQPQSEADSISDLREKMGTSVVMSFKARCDLYMHEIRRLDVQRSSKVFDFRQMFLVKESLALMFQMIQLPSEALVQYEEIESLLNYAQKAEKRVKDEAKDKGLKEKQEVQRGDKGNTERRSSARKSTKTTTKTDKWADLGVQADSILKYSINAARMKVLKNRMGLLEMNRYIFARECYFLLKLRRPSECASKALTFIKQMRTAIEVRLHTQAEENETVEESEASSPLYRQMLSNFWAIIASLRIITTCTEVIHRAKTLPTGRVEKKGGDEALQIGNLLHFSSSMLLALLTRQDSDPLRTFQDKASEVVSALKSWASHDAALHALESLKREVPDGLSSCAPVAATMDGSFTIQPKEISHFSFTLEGLLRRAWQSHDTFIAPSRSETAPLVLQLTRILAQHHRLAGRSRSAVAAQSLCADILIYQGRVDEAVMFVSCALELLQGQSRGDHAFNAPGQDSKRRAESLHAGGCVRSTSYFGAFGPSTERWAFLGAPSTVRSGNGNGSDNGNDNGNGKGYGGGEVEWVNIRFQLLRRLLFCHRMAAGAAVPGSSAHTLNTCEYIATTLQLLDPRFQHLFEYATHRDALQADLVSLVQNEMPGAPLPKGLRLVLPAQPLFHFAIEDSLATDGGDESKEKLVSVSPGTKSVRGAVYRVTDLTHDVSSGVPRVPIAVESYLPNSVVLRKDAVLRLVMEPFLSEVLSMAVGGSVDHGNGTNLQSADKYQSTSDPEEICFFGAFEDDPRPLLRAPENALELTAVGDGADKLTPGRQQIHLGFIPRTSGEFSVRTLSMQMGNVTFVDSNMHTPSWLRGLSRDDVFLRVNAAPEMLSIRSSIPPTSPLGQRDCLSLHLHFEADEVIRVNVSERYGCVDPPTYWRVSEGRLAYDRGVTVTDVGNTKGLTVQVPFTVRDRMDMAAAAAAVAAASTPDAPVASRNIELEFVVDAEFIVRGCCISRTLTHSCAVNVGTMVTVTHSTHECVSGSTSIVAFCLRSVVDVPLLVSGIPPRAKRAVNGGEERRQERANQVPPDSHQEVRLLPGQTFTVCTTVDTVLGWEDVEGAIVFSYRRESDDDPGCVFSERYAAGASVLPRDSGGAVDSGSDAMVGGSRHGVGDIVAPVDSWDDLSFHLGALSGVNASFSSVTLGSVNTPQNMGFLLTICSILDNAKQATLESIANWYTSKIAVQAGPNWTITGQPSLVVRVVDGEHARVEIEIRFDATPLATGVLELPYVNADGRVVYSSQEMMPIIVL